MAAGKSEGRFSVRRNVDRHLEAPPSLSFSRLTRSGIVGYGHIGSQLSVLAESIGISVLYYDVVNLMSMGTSKQVSSLEELLRRSNFVSLHVPELPETRNMISEAQFEQMQPGSYLINASRGHVVDIPALINVMRSGKLAGAALDVYPSEPGGNGDYFTNQLDSWVEDLRSLKNLILTPHIGGSTEEAQRAIGLEGVWMMTWSTMPVTGSWSDLLLPTVPSRRSADSIRQRGVYPGRCQPARGQPSIVDAR